MFQIPDIFIHESSNLNQVGKKPSDQTSRNKKKKASE